MTADHIHIKEYTLSSIKDKLELWYTYTHICTQMLLDETDAHKVCLINEKQMAQNLEDQNFFSFLFVHILFSNVVLIKQNMLDL